MSAHASAWLDYFQIVEEISPLSKNSADHDVEFARRVLVKAREAQAKAAVVQTPQWLDIWDLRDRLAAVSHAIANSDDRAAQATLRETLQMLAAHSSSEGGQP